MDTSFFIQVQSFIWMSGGERQNVNENFSFSVRKFLTRSLDIGPNVGTAEAEYTVYDTV